jgi:hypothetical protein
MTQVTHPTQQQVREYLARRLQERTPPPAPEEIRRQLGWELIEAERASGQQVINRG